MASSTLNLPSLLTLALAIISLNSLSFTEAQTSGFSVELIHRDSPKSPFYNPSDTTYNRLANALRRSFNRANRFKLCSSSTKAIEADIIADSGEYLMNISIGTPAFHIIAIADTGSDLIWTQCTPCSKCFKQNAPLFNPSKSSTYRKVPCSTSLCRNLEGSSCPSDKFCEYSVSYGDNSFSEGDLASDTLTFASTTGLPVAVPKTVIGCGHKNDGTFDENSSGIIGLGVGDVSLINQLGSEIAGKFSYCLLPIPEAGKSTTIKFGTDAIVSGSGVVSTPLAKQDSPSFYFLTLEAVSVESDRIKFTDSSSFGSGDGNIIIDSGTTLTFVPPDFYSELESAVSSRIKAKKVSGPENLNLCYDATTDFAVPEITMHFTGADVKLAPLNTFVLVSEKVSCFSFTPVEGLAIYGNLAQMNFLVGYDTVKRTVSFKPTDCNKN